jgi:hypothetical protein
MQEAYGHQFNSQFGEEPTETWERLLTGITPDQIRDGLEKLASRKDTWPPNAQEFRSLCLPDKIAPDGHHNSSAYLSFDDPEHPEHEFYGKRKRIESDDYKTRKRKKGNETLSGLKGMFGSTTTDEKG